MEKSYEEIRHILQLMGQEKMFGSIYKGSEAYLPDEKTPVISDAAKDLAKRAMEYSEDESAVCDRHSRHNQYRLRHFDEPGNCQPHCHRMAGGQCPGVAG